MNKKYTAIFSDAAGRQLSKMDRHDAGRIVHWVEKNLDGTDDPRQFGKRLSANFAGFWRYRVGKYRIIAEIRDMEIVVEIVSVGHRAHIYDS